MAPSSPPTPPPDVQSAEHHLTQVLSLGDAKPYVIKIILAHVDHPHPDPHVIHRTLSPFLSDPTPIVKSLFAHLKLPLYDDRRRRPRTESEERYRQYRRERRRERRRRKEEDHRSRKRHRRDYDEYSPVPESDRPKRRRHRSSSRDRDRSPLDRSRDASPDKHGYTRSPTRPVHDRLPRDRIREQSPRDRLRDLSPRGRLREHSPRDRVRDHSPRDRLRERSPKKRTRERSPKRRGRDRSPLYRPRNRPPLEEHLERDRPRRKWDDPGRARDAPTCQRTRNGPTSPVREDGGRADRSRGLPRTASPQRLKSERREENGNVKGSHRETDPGSSLDSKLMPKQSNRLRDLRSKVLASLSKPAEDGSTENL